MKWVPGTDETLVTVYDGRWRHQEMNAGRTGSKSDQSYPRRISTEFLNVFLNPVQGFIEKALANEKKNKEQER